MTNELKFDLIRVMVKHGIVSETYLRNEEIISEYKELRDAEMKGKEARLHLANKYCTSIKNIEFILYGKKKNGI